MEKNQTAVILYFKAETPQETVKLRPVHADEKSFAH